jgi:nitrogen fixation protein FixH
MTSAAVNGFTRRRWPLIIIGLLVVQAAGIITMVVISGRDPSFAVEPDYYQKALAWDDAARQRQAGADLGWTVDLHAGAEGLSVELHDALGRPLDGAQVEAEVFHHARAADRHTIALAAAGDGLYRGTTRLARRGHWEVRLLITRGPELLTLTRQVEVGGGSGGGGGT